ncbi:hypothetical protein IWW37_005594 [Coemansia sp. RSA 2050]|nr:hypothetical protein IWW37_005594 [Coemansia sp. RSA 2050]KAJ2731392.1 hypothetical protein IW152_004593 [Coemansia sp. BCRC 34962]
MADSPKLAFKPLGSTHRQFLHTAGAQHGCGSLLPKSHLASTATQWMVPLFAASNESASGIANPTPAPAMQGDFVSAGRAQHLNARVSTAVARIQHKSPALGAALARTEGGRVDKRKLRQPTRSLVSHGGTRAGGADKQPDGFHTVKMAYIDEYQRNPTAYSRALMDSERPGTCRSSHLLPLALSHNAGMQGMARRASLPRPRLSIPPSPQQTQLLPSPQPIPALRKSKSATIHRLFPSLREPMEVLSAALRIGAGSMSPSSASHRAGLATSSVMSNAEHLTPSKPSPLSIEDICATPSYHRIHQRHQSHPTPGSMAALASVPCAASSDTSSRASTPRSATSSRASSDHPSMPSGEIDLDDELSREISELRPTTTSCSVKWSKAAPMDVSTYPKVELLAPAERECCSILRLLPEQYLAIKQSLVRAGRTLPKGTFKKRDAQKLCRVDVNKTSKVFEWFCKLEWIPQACTRLNHSFQQSETGKEQQHMSSC